MYLTDTAEIVIDAPPETVWEYVTDPVHWAASNPEEHYPRYRLADPSTGGRPP